MGAIQNYAGAGSKFCPICTLSYEGESCPTASCKGKMPPDTIVSLKADLAAVTQEREELKADTVRFNIHLEQKDGAIATNAKYCEELKSNHPERVYILRAEAAEKERDELKRLLQDTCNTLHAYSQDNKHAEMARMIKERDHLRAEKLLILAQVTESDTLIRDALQLPPETEWRVEFYAELIAGQVREIVRLRAGVLKAHEGANCIVQYSDNQGVCVCDICEPLRAGLQLSPLRTYERGAEECQR